MMDLIKYLGKKVRVDLTISNYFYEGVVTDADENSIEIKDRNNKMVTLSISSIAFIREVGNEN